MEGLGVWGVTHRLNVVPIWADDEGAVVVRVVLWPQARGSIVFAAGCERRRVKLSDLFSTRCGEGDVYWTGTSTE
jgi:hypothetical protein